MKTTEAIEAFIAAKVSKGLSTKTLTNYRCWLQKFAKNCPDLPIETLPIEAFLATRGPSLETRHSYYRLFAHFYRWLHNRKLIPANPLLAIEPPRLTPRVPRGLSLKELRQLLTHPSHRPAVRAFLYLLADTGLRLSEALSVRPRSFTENSVIVRGKVGEREVPVSPEVRYMVLDTLPWPWHSSDAASHAVRKAFRRAGINGRRASAHTLRHTFARFWRGSDTTLVGIMGWTTPRMLTRYRPYDLVRATEEHHQHSPLRSLGTATQLALFP